jgi:predicted PurR-regulated permease PerM
MSPEESFNRMVLRVLLVVLAVVGALALVWLLRKPLSWLVLALFVAVAMSRPVNRLEQRMPRGAAIAMSYLLLLAVPLTIAGMITPTIVNGANDLAQKAPQYVNDLQDSVAKNKKLQKLDDQYGITKKLEQEASKLPSKIGDAAGVLTDIGIGIVNSIFSAVTVLVLSIFMVAGGRGWVEAGLRMVPEQRRRPIKRALENSASAVGNYVGGVLVQVTIAGVSTFVVLKILGVPFAAPLAVLTALFDAIPLVGATLAAILIGVITLFVNFPVATIAWVIWAVIYQQVENYLIQPRIQSKAVNVHPFVVLVSVLFGSTLFGIPGALLAIPVAASAQIAIAEYVAYRRELAEARLMDPPEPEGGPAPGVVPA